MTSRQGRRRTCQEKMPGKCCLREAMEDEKQIKAPRDMAPLSTNHRRAITSVMLLLDELVCRSEDLASGRAVSSVLYRERNDLSESQRSALGRKSREIRGHLAEIVEKLGLKSREKDLAAALRWQSSSTCDYLHEIGSRRLRAYGPVPSELAQYLDGKIEEINILLKELLDV